MLASVLEKGVNGIEDIVDAVMADYDVDEATCKADVQTVLDQLEQYKILASCQK